MAKKDKKTPVFVKEQIISEIGLTTCEITWSLLAMLALSFSYPMYLSLYLSFLHIFTMTFIHFPKLRHCPTIACKARDMKMHSTSYNHSPMPKPSRTPEYLFSSTSSVTSLWVREERVWVVGSHEYQITHQTHFISQKI